MATIIDELVAMLGYDVRGEGDLRQFNKSLDQLEKKAFAVGQAMGRMAAIAGAALAGGMAFLGKSVLDTSAKFESYAATLETIEGSAEGAEKALDWISTFAQTTPYEVDELTSAFVKLRSYGLDPLDGTMTTIGDTASAMGKGLDQAVEAWADATTGEFERLKEFGIRAKQAGEEVTFIWTENGQEMRRTIKKTSADITRFLNETMGRKFAGAMVRQSKTWNGMMSNLGDSWTDFQRRIGDAGFFDVVKNKLADLLEVVGQWQSDGTIERIAGTLSAAFTTAANVIGWVVGRISTHIGFLNANFEKMKPWLQAIGIAFGALAAWAFPLVSGFFVLGLVVDDVLTALEGGDSIIGDFIKWVQSLPQALAEASSAFGSWLSNIDWNALGQEAGRMLVDALVAAVIGTVAGSGDIGQWVVDAFTSIDWGAVGLAWYGAILAILGFIAGLFSGITGRIWEIIRGWFNVNLTAMGTRMGQQILNGLKGMGAQIASWFAGLVPEWARGLVGGGVPQGMAPGNTFTPFSTGAAPGLQNMNDNVARMNAGQATANVIQTDNTQNTQTVNVQAPVNVNVTQAADAPAAVGAAVGAAVNKGVQPSRLNIGGSF